MIKKLNLKQRNYVVLGSGDCTVLSSNVSGLIKREKHAEIITIDPGEDKRDAHLELLQKAEDKGLIFTGCSGSGSNILLGKSWIRGAGGIGKIDYGQIRLIKNPHTNEYFLLWFSGLGFKYIKEFIKKTRPGNKKIVFPFSSKQVLSRTSKKRGAGINVNQVYLTRDLHKQALFLFLTLAMNNLKC